MYSVHQGTKVWYKDTKGCYVFHVKDTEYYAKQFFVDANFILAFTSIKVKMTLDEIPF